MEDSTTFEKFERVRTLIQGINPAIDKALTSCSTAIGKLKKLQEGEVIELTLEALPEETDKEKRRKKAILLLLSSWRNLRSEVKRVMALYGSGKADGKMTAQEHAGTLAKIFAFAKGPFGLVTVAAALIAGVLILLNSMSVTIVIKNRGCKALVPFVRLPFPIPGIELPTANIPDGGQGVARVSPLTVDVDGTRGGLVVISALRFSMEYQLETGAKDVVFNGQSLLGKKTTINLGDSKEHELIVLCSP